MSEQEPKLQIQCECGIPRSQCIKGDLAICPEITDCHNEYDDEVEEDREADCGRWINGRLGRSCLLAGTEWCDWECPLS